MEPHDITPQKRIEANYDRRLGRVAIIMGTTAVSLLVLGVASGVTYKSHALRNVPFRNDPAVVQYEGTRQRIHNLESIRRRNGIGMNYETSDEIAADPNIPQEIKPELDALLSTDADNFPTNLASHIQDAKSSLQRAAENPRVGEYVRQNQRIVNNTGYMGLGGLAAMLLTMAGMYFPAKKLEAQGRAELQALSQ